MVVREEEFRFGWGDTRGMSNLSGASVIPHVGTGTHVLGPPSVVSCFYSDTMCWNRQCKLKQNYEHYNFFYREKL